MSPTKVIFFCDPDGEAPVVVWLRKLQRKDRRAFARCVALISRLREAGHELRRPTSAPLRDGIHELRGRVGHVNYRLLYFFHGQGVAVLAHGMTKEARVLPADMERALRRKLAFEANPRAHTYREPKE